jgi:hypothetical protein
MEELPSNNIFVLGIMTYINEDDLEVGKSYTMVFTREYGRNKGQEYKEFFGKYYGINEIDETTGYPGMSSYPTGRKLKQRMFERPNSLDGSKGLKVGHFTNYDIKIEEGDTTKQTGGRRTNRKTKNNKRKRNKRKTRR